MKRALYLVTILVTVLLAAGVSAQVIINEVDSDQVSDDTQEFIELYDGGIGNTDLTGYVVVLFTGIGDVSYDAFDLDGYTTDSMGYFVIGSLGMGTDIEVDPGSSGWLENGPDAVALFLDDATSFPDGTAVTAINLVDALVYDTDDGDALNLIATLLNAGQGQINENENGTGELESMGRCPNGTGGAMNTDAYSWDAPSAGSDNVCILATPTPIPTATPTWPPAPPCDQEYMANGDMESWVVNGAAGPPDEWIVTSAFGSTITAQQESSEVHGGSYSTVITKTHASINDAGHLSQTVVYHVLPNTVYELSAWVYDNAYQGNGRLQLRFKDSSGGLVQYNDFSSYSQTSPDWQELSLVAVSHPDASFAEVRFWIYDTDSEDVTLYLDDVTLIEPCFPVPTPTVTPTPYPTATPTTAPCDTNLLPNAGFEDWTGVSVDSWYGEIGVIPFQNTAQVHEGISSAEISNTRSGTDFTSSYVPVQGGQIYEGGIWLIDNDPDVNAQFYVLFYNQDVNWIGSTTWQYTAGEDPNWQEMTIGQVWVPSSARWARMRVRFVDNSGGTPPVGGSLTLDDSWLIEPCNAPTPTPTAQPTAAVVRTIYDIQYTSDPSGVSPHVGTTVFTTGIITAVETGNPYIFIQDNPSYWSGLMIYVPSGPGTLRRGDMVQVQGVVTEMHGNTTIYDPDFINRMSSGHPVPSVSVTAPQTMSQEAYESVLVQLQNVTITNINTTQGEWTVSAAGYDAIVDDIYTYSYLPTDGETLDWVQGPVMEVSGTYKLEPREDDDISATIVPIPTTGTLGLMLLLMGVGALIRRKIR